MAKMKIVITKGKRVYVDEELFADYSSRNDGTQLAKETAFDLHKNGEAGDGKPTHYWQNMPQHPYA